MMDDDYDKLSEQDKEYYVKTLDTDSTFGGYDGSDKMGLQNERNTHIDSKEHDAKMEFEQCMKDNHVSTISKLRKKLGEKHYNIIMTRENYYQAMTDAWNAGKKTEAREWSAKLNYQYWSVIRQPDFEDKIDRGLWLTAQKFRFYQILKERNAKKKDKFIKQDEEEEKQF